MARQRTVPRTGTWFSRGLYFCFLKTRVEVLAEMVNVCGVVESGREAAWRRLCVSVFGKGMLSQLPWSGRAVGLRGDH